MASFDRCPVCGGPIVESEVEEGLKGGIVRETVNVRTEVCMKCGERLYTPEGAQRHENSRLKHEAKSTAIMQDEALRAKMKYEIWFLSFLEHRIDRARENDQSPVLRITSGVVPANIKMTFEDSLSNDESLILAMMPLTFVGSFKVLDMIFEWVLEENCKLGKIPQVPWRFADKEKMLNKASILQLPRLFDTHPHLLTYARAVFCKLVPYRNEVIHSNSFSVSGDELTLSSSRKGTTLTLSGDQVDGLARFVRILARALIGEISVDEYKHRVIRHYLDLLAPVHGLAKFNQQMPRFVPVELTATRIGPAFPANLKQVRDLISKTFGDQDVFFDLKVIAVDGEEIVSKWHFAPDEVPDVDVLTFYEESHKAHREEIVG
ncbi:MAG: hypothetical protein OXU79_16870 [Gemmatimonadota bacterium]|nr:hypothetical protein [Gemmatimonadota bacterium]